MEEPLQTQPPAAFYQSRRTACERETALRRRQHLALGYLRLGWALTLLLGAWFSLFRHMLSWEWLLVPLIGFGVSARFHTRVLAAGARAQRSVAWCLLGQARVEDRWAHLHPRSTRIDHGSSLYAADLDLFGAGSLFELLCSARTSLGEDALASWLLRPASLEELRARQSAVQELRACTALREAFASAPGPDPLLVDREALASWGEALPSALPGALRWLAPLLVACTLAATFYAAILHSLLPLVPVLLVNGVLTYLLQRRFRPLFSQALDAAQKLASVAGLLARVEAGEFCAAPRLREIKARLLARPTPASAALGRLAHLSSAVEQRSNWILRILDVPLLYSVQLGLLLQSWLQAYGRELRPWLDSLGEFEALLSLSAFHFDHPEDPFPEFAEAELTFGAHGLGHPLLPRASCVRNDVTLDAETRLLLVSGSNMSGKSTLLRSIGCAAVLAMAGAPVRAHRLRLSLVHIGASIQVQDSLQGGRSRFYAEILRLRAIRDLALQTSPVLLLLDELLAGTNSRDRLEGATGLVQELLALGALGFLSTHDLALTELTGSGAPHVRNVHFEDSILHERLHFDYRLRPGVVTRSNGLDLMRLIGLRV